MASVLFAGVFIYVRSYGASIYAVITKALASFCFVMLFALSVEKIGYTSSGNMAILLGLVAGLIGDIVLDLKVTYSESENEYLNAGFAAFGVGHLMYTIGMLGMASTYEINVLTPILIAFGAAAVLTVATYFATTKLMKFDFGKNIIVAFVYTFVLYFVTALAIALAINNLAFIGLAIGLGFFLLSDLILSMQYFGGKAKNNMLQIFNHTTYYIGQILIACTAFIAVIV